ncbi:MAG: hypothetical protein K2Y39_18535 [Candidatus Obscuribacterales bacterium]|nr:hypothetical protein [Candidatus Obscuribacterales bacterium]
MESSVGSRATWRATYGSDADSTLLTGVHEEREQPAPWRKSYAADLPMVVSSNSPSAEVDPLTGEALVRPVEETGNNGSASGVQPNVWLQQSEIKRQRALVDKALEYNAIGTEGNLLAGGIGGVVGARAVPTILNRYTRNVFLEPDAVPGNFRERVTKFWRESYDPNSWNGPDLEFLGRKIHGPNGLLKQMTDFNQPVQPALKWRTERSTLFEPFTKVNTFADDIERAKAAERAITANQQAIAANGGQGKALFSTKELKLLEELKQPGAVMPAGLQGAIRRNDAAQALLEFRGDTFSKLSDTKIPLASKAEGVLTRLSTANNGVAAHEQLVLAGQKGLFSADELAALKEYQSSAQSALLATEASAASRVKSFIGDFGPSFVKGAGVAGSLMVVDHYADQLLFGKNHGNGIGDSINSALVPAALFIGPKTSMLKIGLFGAAAIVGGKLIEKSLSPGDEPSYSRYFKQSTTESFVLAAEALLPIQRAATLSEGASILNWKRAGLIAGTWLAFRGLNMLLEPVAPAHTRDQAWKLLEADVNSRTDGSMIEAIDKFGALGAGDEAHGLMAWSNVFKEGMGKTKGARGEAALQVYRTEWLTKPTSEFGSMLEANRGAVILCTAFAESRLSHGTHITTITDMPTYLLEGMNLDVGAKAARDLIIARINVDNAKKQVEENLGKEIAGKKVDQSEIADLDKVKQRIEEGEAKIYGEHDMFAAVKELAKWGEGMNATHMAKLEVDLRNTIAANRNSADDRYKAKLFRDLATLYLSSGYAKQDTDPQSTARLLGGDTYSGRQAIDIDGQQRGFDGALDCIALAYELDRNNPDVAQLYQIAQQINAKLPGNIQKQMSNGKYNPLQIRQ